MLHSLEPSLAIALQKLERAISFLEGAVAFKRESEKRKGDIELELQLMQDDRVRLAEELDGTSNRLIRIESVVSAVDERVGNALETIEDVLATSDESSPNNAE